MKLVQRLLLLGFILALSGCIGWRRTTLPAPAPDAPLRLGAARVTDVRGYTVELHSVVVSADSVVGWRAREPSAGERLALHRAQVRSIQRQRFDFVRTALTLGAFAAVLAFLDALSAA
jgi:hypothetical protein